MALLACGARFFSREFVRVATRMGRSATHGRNFTLALPVHRGETPSGTNGLEVGRFDFHGKLLLKTFSS
jgi:hypothetical protein